MAQAASRRADKDRPGRNPAAAPLRPVAAERTSSALEGIAVGLYRATLDLLRRSDDPAAQRHHLLDPLSKAVASQRTREGQRQCARLEAALAARDYDTALDACIGLIDLARALTPPPE